MPPSYVFSSCLCPRGGIGKTQALVRFARTGEPGFVLVRLAVGLTVAGSNPAGDFLEFEHLW